MRRSHETYPKTGAIWKEGQKRWVWPELGACLKLRHIERDLDAYLYQGQQQTWIGWDELPNWPTLFAYNLLKGNLRWAEADIPTKRIRASGNPGGPGHSAVKEYFIDHAPLGYKPYIDPDSKMSRMFIPSRVYDNKILLERDPGYINRLKAVGSPALVRAWLDGDWNAVLGAFYPEFGDTHIIPPCDLDEHLTRFMSFDWGSHDPFSIGYWAVADNSDGRFPKNSLIQYNEWYGGHLGEGLHMIVPQIADGIKAREKDGLKLSYRVAGRDLFIRRSGPSLAEEFSKHGIHFQPADDKRIPGWEQVRMRLVGVDNVPALYFFSTCTNSIRTLPLAQHDPAKANDLILLDDHCLDMIRYAATSRPWAKEAPQKKPLIKTPTLNDLLDQNGLYEY